MKSNYHREGDFIFLDSVEVSGFTKKGLSTLLLELTNKEGTVSVSLVGVPAAINCRKNKDLKELYARSSLNVIDGMPIVKRLVKLGLPNERCSAPDFMPYVFEDSIEEGKTHYFYGGKNQEVLDKMISNVKAKHPGIRIVGSYCPPFRPLTEKEDKQVVDEINRLNPDFIWVGIGAPKQEKWIDAHADKVSRGVMLGVGASFDFFAGTLKKAPKWIEKLSLEWLYRFFKEPKRLFRRYIIGGIQFNHFRFIDWISGKTRKNNKISKERITKHGKQD